MCLVFSYSADRKLVQVKPTTSKKILLACHTAASWTVQREKRWRRCTERKGIPSGTRDACGTHGPRAQNEHRRYCCKSHAIQEMSSRLAGTLRCRSLDGLRDLPRSCRPPKISRGIMAWIIGLCLQWVAIRRFNPCFGGEVV